MPIGCRPVRQSTQARSFSLTPNAAAWRGGTPSVALLLPRRELRRSPPGPVMSTMASPFSGRKASRNTIEPIAEPTCSATPDTTKPP